MRNLFLILFLCTTTYLQTANGQLNILSADTVIATAYNEVELQDSIYIFHGPGPNGWSIEMKAEATDTTGLLSNFEWFKLNTSIDENWESIQTDIQVDTSLLTTSISGGYKLHFANERIDTTYYFWLYSDDLNVQLFYKKDCFSLEIEGITGGVDFKYYDIREEAPFTTLWLGNRLIYDLRLDFFNDEFQAWDPVETQPSYTVDFINNTINLAPLTEHQLYRFVVSINDSLGHSTIDSMIYQAIRVEANFTASINDEDIDETQPQIEGEASFKVQFKNLSKNAISYEWIFWNRTESFTEGADTVWKKLYNFEPLDSITYERPGNYTVKLKAYGRTFIQDGIEKTCIDSMVNKENFIDYIKVLPSTIGKFPNVITPGRETNNTFKFMTDESTTKAEGTKPVSLREMEIKIYNRSGQKVHEYQGDDDNWEGWNGKRNDKGRYVQDGVYFWVINAIGWDDKEYQQRGFVHVYSK